jgi:VanZ family protein
MPWQTVELVHHTIRKSAHAVEYAVLGVLIWRLVHSSAALASHRPAWHYRFTLMLAALYAASDETHQIFVPGRQPAVTDVLLDTCGAALGLAVAWCVLQMRKPKRV